MTDPTEGGIDFPDIVGAFMARSIIHESGCIVLSFSHSSGQYRVLLDRATFLFADIEIGKAFPCVKSCSVTNRPEPHGSRRKQVEIGFDAGTLAIAYDEAVYVKRAWADEAKK